MDSVRRTLIGQLVYELRNSMTGHGILFWRRRVRTDASQYERRQSAKLLALGREAGRSADHGVLEVERNRPR